MKYKFTDKARERATEQRCKFPGVYRSCTNKSAYLEETALHLLEELNSMPLPDRSKVLAYPREFNRWMKDVTHGAKPSTRAIYKKKMAEIDDRIPFIAERGTAKEKKAAMREAATKEDIEAVKQKVNSLLNCLSKHRQEELEIWNDCV